MTATKRAPKLPTLATIRIEMTNEAFTVAPLEEVARILEAVANSLRMGEKGKRIRLADFNGNTVGEFRVQ